MKHSILSIDIETYSDVDLTKCGVYAYTDSPNFEVLLFGYAFDDEPVQVIDFASGQHLPDEVAAALTAPTVTKTAFNASFERVCLGRYLDLALPTDQWYCTATQALLLGLPLSLSEPTTVLQSKDDFGNQHFTPVPKRNYERRVGCPYIKKEA